MAAPPIVAAAADGTFFLAAPPRTGGQERIYRFCLTGSGQVTGFSAVPGGELPAGQYVDALAATPDGSQLAAGATFAPPPPPRHTANGTIMYATLASDEIFVINTATGARSAWDGGKAGLVSRS